MPPGLFLSCDPSLTDDGSGVLSDPVLVDNSSPRHGFPSSAGRTEGLWTFLFFHAEVGGWLPTLTEVDVPPLIGQDLHDVVQKKKTTAGSLDGWWWRDLEAFQVSLVRLASCSSFSG